MDSYREHPSDFDAAVGVRQLAVRARAVDIGSDERRMHVRAYNYWVSLLDGRDYPSIEDLEPGEVSDFADEQRPARLHRRPRQSRDALHRRRHPRGMRA